MPVKEGAIAIAIGVVIGLGLLLITVGAGFALYKSYRDKVLKRETAARRIELQARGPEIPPTYGDALRVDDPLLFVKATPMARPNAPPDEDSRPLPAAPPPIYGDRQRPLGLIRSVAVSSI